MQLIITNAGEELISRLISETAAARFTKVSTTDHDYSGIDPKTLTELDDVKQTVLISDISRVDKTLVEIIAAFDNKELKIGYYTRALGVYAEDQDGNEILFGVGIEQEHPSYLPPFSGRTVSSITYRLNIKVNNSEQVKIEVDPGAYMTVEQFNRLLAGSVEVSSNPIPAVGTRTHYYIVKNVPNYKPYDPDTENVQGGMLETENGTVRGYVQAESEIHPMAILVE